MFDFIKSFNPFSNNEKINPEKLHPVTKQMYKLLCTYGNNIDLKELGYDFGTYSDGSPRLFSDLLQYDILRYLGFLSATDNRISNKEVEFMNYIFDEELLLKLDSDEYCDWVQNEVINDEVFLETSPDSLDILCRYYKSNPIAEPFVKMYANMIFYFGIDFRYYDDINYNFDDEEDIFKYLYMIETYISIVVDGCIDLKDAYEEQIMDKSKIRFNGMTEYFVNPLLDKKEDIPLCVVFIQTNIGEGSGFLCSDNGYIVTCNHVIEDAKEMYVKVNRKNDKYEIYRAEYVCASDELDIAIIKIQGTDFHYAEIDFDRDKPGIGEEVEIFGYPFGSIVNDDVLELNCSVTKGRVASNQKVNNIDISLLNIEAKSGNSGSPVISMKNGKVIGILRGSFRPNGDEEINYMHQIKYIKNLLEADD